MSSLLTPGDRQDLWDRVGDVVRRVARLEAVPSVESLGAIRFDILNVGDWLSIETTDGLGTTGQTFITHGGGFNVTDHAGGGFNVSETGGGGFNVQETDGGISLKELGSGGVLVQDAGDGLTIHETADGSAIAINNSGAGGGVLVQATGASSGAQSFLALEQGTLPDGLTGVELRTRQDAGATPTGEIFLHTTTNAGADRALLRLGSPVDPVAQLQSSDGTHGCALLLDSGDAVLSVFPGRSVQVSGGTGGGTSNNATQLWLHANLSFDVHTSEPAAPAINTALMYAYFDGSHDHIKVIFHNGTKVTLATD